MFLAAFLRSLCHQVHYYIVITESAHIKVAIQVGVSIFLYVFCNSYIVVANRPVNYFDYTLCFMIEFNIRSQKAKHIVFHGGIEQVTTVDL